MSRAATGDTVVVRPSNNVYTALLIAATLAQILTLLVVWMKYGALVPQGNPFSG